MTKLKLYLLLIIGLGSISNALSQSLIPKVDERVELLTIIARLASFEEFSDTTFEIYTQDINTYFEKYQEHNVIKLLKNMRNSNGLGYDALINMAVILNPAPNLNINKNIDLKSFDNRWDKEKLKLFISELQDFYRISQFSKFYKNHKNLYQDLNVRMSKVSEKVNLNWFESFFGIKAKGNYNLIVAPGIGKGNYGPIIKFNDGTSKRYSVIGMNKLDSFGMPIFPQEDNLNILIHELCHTYINELIDEHIGLFRSGTIQVFDFVKNEMQKQAYGSWNIMLNESLVRASVMMYLKDYSLEDELIDREINEQIYLGFYWMKHLVDLFDTYKNNRNKFLKYEDFLFRIRDFYNNLYPQLKGLKKDFINKSGYVLSTFPKNEAIKVDYNITEIKFNFNKGLSPDRYAFGPSKLGIEHYPDFYYSEEEDPTGKRTFIFSNDNKSITIKVKLKPNTKYEIFLTGKWFKTIDKHYCKNYLLKFETGN